MLERIILSALDDRKGDRITSIDLRNKSDFADIMIIASGTSQRHMASLADAVIDALKEAGLGPIPVEGKDSGEWVLVDAGDIIVNIFHPEAREHYNLEKMWSIAAAPQLEATP